MENVKSNAEKELHKLDWIPIPNSSFVIKYIFYDAEYHIIATDLTSVYEEKLDAAKIQKRFNDMNTSINMKTNVIIQNIKKTLEMILFNNSEVIIHRNDSELIVKLQFSVAHATCIYDMTMEMLPSSMVQLFIIKPILLGALLSQRKVMDLQKKIDLNSSSGPSKISLDWLEENTIPDMAVIESFLKLQKYFKGLLSESCEAYYSLKREKRESISSESEIVSPKKIKYSKNNEPANIKYGDQEDDNKPIKEEVNTNIPHPEPAVAPIRKKKIFKI